VSINFAPQIVGPAAPFTDAQRAWLNRLFAEALLQDLPAPPVSSTPTPPAEDESTPWKDPAMPLVERLALAAARPERW
jgi:sulfite reductase (NADPH) flavoprotein alpha-component